VQVSQPLRRRIPRVRHERDRHRLAGKRDGAFHLLDDELDGLLRDRVDVLPDVRHERQLRIVERDERDRLRHPPARLIEGGVRQAGEHVVDGERRRHLRVGVEEFDDLPLHPLVVRARPGRPRQRRRTASVRLERTRFHGPEAAVIHRVNLPFGEGIDPTRSVVVNDGWEHTVLNIITLHDYEEDGEQFLARYVRREEILGNRMPFNNDRYALARGYEYRASRSSSASTAASRSRRTPAGATATTSGTKRSSSSRKITAAIKATPYVRGYCYTQITDVQQETNGLLTEGRKPKVDPDKIRAVNLA